jgi:hypothetical protein
MKNEWCHGPRNKKGKLEQDTSFLLLNFEVTSVNNERAATNKERILLVQILKDTARMACPPPICQFL